MHIYVEVIETNLGQPPHIKVHGGDIGQVVLNLVVNAAQPIEEKKGDSDAMGTIRVEKAEETDGMF